MTTQQDQIELQGRLRDVLGDQPAATLWTMLLVNDQVATKTDLSNLGEELRAEMSGLRNELRSEMASIRQEMDLKFATKDDLLELRRDFDTSLRSFVRSFMTIQAGSMVALTGIVLAITRLT